MVDSKSIIEWGGILIVLILIFAETGLLLGLIIPGGETLIFTSGLLVSTGTLNINIYLFLLLLVVAGFLGDCSGYYIGRKMGPRLYRKKDTWYFKKKYLKMTENYFNKHKRTSIIIGKFFPIVRPFVPLISGESKIKLPIFFSLSILSVSLYMSAFLLAGYFLANRFPAIENYLHWILPISVIVLLIPVIVQIRKNS